MASIIGPGGVGKTTLARILSGEFDWLLDSPWDYAQSYRVEESSLKDDPKVRIVVPPGQTPRRESTWAEVERRLVAGEYRGVILVSANGYHTMPRGSYKTHALYRGNKDRLLEVYTQWCWEEELAVFGRIATSLQTVSGKLWLLSMVAKEDLWWTDRQSVERPYGKGSRGEPCVLSI